MYKTNPAAAIEIAKKERSSIEPIDNYAYIMEEHLNVSQELNDLREKLKTLDEKGDSYGYGIIKNWIELKEEELRLVGTNSEDLQKVLDEESRIEKEYHAYVEDLKKVEEIISKMESTNLEEFAKREEEERKLQEIERAEEEELIRKSVETNSFDSGSGPKM